MTKKEFLADLMAKYPQLIGVSFGTKITDGKLTGKKSIKFRVEEKKPIQEINENDALPPYVEFGGDVYQTDVVGGKKYFHVSGVFPQGARPLEQITVTPIQAYAGGSTSIEVNGLTEAQVIQINNSLTMKWDDVNQVFVRVEEGGSNFDGKISGAVFNNPTTTITTSQGLAPISVGETVDVFFRGDNGDGELSMNGLAPGIPQLQPELPTPLKCGASMGSDADIGFLGTIGCLAQDIDNNNVVALTNAHVAAGIKYGHQYRQAYTSNPADLLTTAVGETWHYPYTETTNHGTVYRVHQNNAQNGDFTDDENTIDAAVLALNNGAWDANSYQMFQSNVLTTNPSWASTSEIDALSGSSTDIFMVGARTGIKGSDIDYTSGIKLRITADNVMSNITVPMDSDIRPDFASISFNDLLEVKAVQSDGVTTCAGVSQGGDSGSAVYANIETSPGTFEWKLIGLLFAGDYADHTGDICRIDNIETKLRVKAYDGTTTTQAATTVDSIVLQGNRTEQFVEHPTTGVRYYRVGLTPDIANIVIP